VVRRHIIDAGSSLVRRMEEVQQSESAPAQKGQSAIWPSRSGAGASDGVTS
jgi:hypothetical protein